MNEDYSKLAEIEHVLKTDKKNSKVFRDWLSAAFELRGDTYIRSMVSDLYDINNDNEKIWISYLMRNSYFDDAWYQVLRLYSENPDNIEKCATLLESAVWLGRASEVVDIALNQAERNQIWLLPAIGHCLIAAGAKEKAKEILLKFFNINFFPESSIKEAALFQLGWLSTYDRDLETAYDCRDKIIQIRKDRKSIQSEKFDWNSLKNELLVDKLSNELLEKILKAITLADDEKHANEVFLLFNILSNKQKEPNLKSSLSENITVLRVCDKNIVDFNLISSLGISPTFVQINAIDDEFIEKFDYHNDIGWKFLDLPAIGLKDFFFGRYAVEHPRDNSRPISMIRRMLHTNKLKAICPWTGMTVESNISYPNGPNIAYKFYGKNEFYIFSIGNFPCRDVLYIPKHNLSIVLQGNITDNQSIECAMHANKIEKIYGKSDYFNENREKSIAILTGFNSNIGHHYMNELSAVDRLFEQGLIKEKSKLIIGPIDFYNIGSLFESAFDEIIKCKSHEEIERITKEMNLFIVRPHDSAAYKSLSDKILKNSNIPSRSEWKNMSHILNNCQINILFTLRRVRRLWRGQEIGIVSLMKKLEKSYPSIAFVFDGITKTDITSQEDELIAEDYNLFSAISTRAKNIGVNAPCLSIIGWNINDKLAVYQCIHIGVVPKGNGHLPNLSWVTNTPCVVHGNSWDISEAMWEAILREDAVQPCIIDRSHITDIFKIEAGTPPVHRRHIVDYDINIQTIYLSIMEMIRKMHNIS